MKQKDLAEKYADLQYKIQQDTPEESPDLSKGIFGHENIVNAFNVGRESVVENIPDLEWNEEDRFGDFCECTEEGYSETPFGIYSILQWYSSPNITIYFAGEQINSNLQSVEQARQIANDDYKKRIKQALGL